MMSIDNNVKKPRNILDLSLKEKRVFLNSFDWALSDMDGVVWGLIGTVPQADLGFRALRTAGKKITFLTNNSVKPMETVVQRLKNMGIEVDVSDIIHPVQSIVDYLQSIKFEGLIYAIGTEVLKNALREAGYQVKDGPNLIIGESLRELSAQIFDNEPVRAVVIDIDFNLSSTKLIKAQIYLQNPDCILVVGATDCLLPLTKDHIVLGPGPYAQILDDYSKQDALVLGKPGKALSEMLIKRYNIEEPQRVLMIGDMLQTDIQFGNISGFQTLLVLTGGTKLKDLLEETKPELLPDYYANSIADIAQLVNDTNKSNM